MPKYTIKKGYEHLVFSQEGVSRISESELESVSELYSPYLTLVKDSNTMTASKPEAIAQVQTPAPQGAVASVENTQAQANGGSN